MVRQAHHERAAGKPSGAAGDQEPPPARVTAPSPPHMVRPHHAWWLLPPVHGELVEPSSAPHRSWFDRLTTSGPSGKPSGAAGDQEPPPARVTAPSPPHMVRPHHAWWLLPPVHGELVEPSSAPTAHGSTGSPRAGRRETERASGKVSGEQGTRAGASSPLSLWERARVREDGS